jgi:indolepyruvate ferredoxin oxidoreductase
MLKGIRGSTLDPFGYHPERKAEREFLVYFLAQTEVLMGLLNAHNQSSILAALSLFDDVRGYGHVRAAAMTKAKVLMAAALQDLNMDEQAYAA